MLKKPTKKQAQLLRDLRLNREYSCRTSNTNMKTEGTYADAYKKVQEI